jgi:hypothetical protein
MAQTLCENLAARIAVTRPPGVDQRDTGYWTATASLRRTGPSTTAGTNSGMTE